MNAARLLQHFNRIGDAPGAVPRLRRFILDLAVRGKLVEQDTRDEPASELLRRIAAEKVRLAEAGKMKPEKSLLPVTDKAAFDLPASWQWTRLGTVTSYIQRGKSPKYSESDGPLVVSQRCVQWRGLDLSVARRIKADSIADYEHSRFLREDDLLWNSTGTGTIGRIIRLTNLPNGLVCDSHVTVVRSLIANPEYLRIWLRSDHVYAQIEDRAAGSTNQVELTAQMAIGQATPVPPLAEQLRIVSKVDELMALCDQLEVARQAREAKRNRLTASSLDRLNAPGPDTFTADAYFALTNLTALTSRADQIKRVRHTILNLAVTGRLSQAECTLDAARDVSEVEKKKLANALRKPKKISPISAAEKWCELPKGWTWARWDQITDWITYGFTRPMPHQRDGIPIITGKNVAGGKIIFNTADKTPAASYDGLNDKDRPQSGDILVTKDGSIGRTAIVGEYGPFCINQSVAVLWLRSCDFNRRYLQLALDCPHTQQTFLANTEGVAIKHISIIDLGKMIFPVPPLAEQHRIVAKVDELMALCDRLEASLAAGDETRSRLLDALIAEALAPTDDNETEAAA